MDEKGLTCFQLWPIIPHLFHVRHQISAPLREKKQNEQDAFETVARTIILLDDRKIQLEIVIVWA